MTLIETGFSLQMKGGQRQGKKRKWLELNRKITSRRRKERTYEPGVVRKGTVDKVVSVNE